MQLAWESYENPMIHSSNLVEQQRNDSFTLLAGGSIVLMIHSFIHSFGSCLSRNAAHTFHTGS